jgi:cytochrome c peroxidase
MTGIMLRYAGFSLLALVAASCDQDEPPLSPLTDAIAPQGYPVGPITQAAPAGNELTEERAQLGKRLFFDKGLSRTGEVACATCHRPEHAFAEPTPVSTGVDGRKGKRNAPALINIAWNESYFWDGRVETLEQQTGKPIEHPDEMDLPLPEAVRRLTADPTYVTAFARAYDAAPDEELLRKALASFVRTLVSGDSPYDRFLGGDQGALPAAARRGLELFFGEKGACFHCHPPGTLTNDGFFNNGSFTAGGDPGRQALTGRTGDLGKFKVPGLRNIGVTGPYMHDGSVVTLEQVVEQYTHGGRGDPSVDPLILPLDLTPGEKSDLLSFLRALTDERFLRDRKFRP